MTRRKRRMTCTYAGYFGKTAKIPLAHFRGGVNGSDVNLFNKRLADDIHGKALRKSDIAQSVLWFTVSVQACDGHEGRVMCDHTEPTAGDGIRRMEGERLD